MLKQVDHSDYFKRCRNESLNKISDPTNNLIIRLDKLIHDFRSEGELGEAGSSRKEFEKRVVPWSENADFQQCNVCKMPFSLTKRRHHCRLCGTVICGNKCSQFLTFSSAKKLTGLEFSADILTALSREDTSDSSSLYGESVDKPNGGRSRRLSAVSLGNSAMNSALPLLNSSLSSVRSRLGSLMSIGENGKNAGMNGTVGQEPSLRVCRQCKALLERRERMMELRMANSVFVDVYQKLSSLLTHIGNLAPSYRNMTESLNNGETMYNLEAANELRKKMIGIQREITTLSERLEQWGLLEDDPLVTHKPTERELQLQRNIKVQALTSLYDSVVGMPDLPTAEQYEQLKEEYRQRMQRQMELEQEMRRRERETSNKSPSSSSSNPVLSATTAGISSLIRRVELRPSSSGQMAGVARRSDSTQELAEGQQSGMGERRANGRRSTKMRPSSSFTGGMGGEESGWVPEENPFQQQQRLNPFLEDQLGEMHPLQQQYLITKSYLEQAAKAGRLDEVEMLERNLRELEMDLKRSELDTPRGPL